MKPRIIITLIVPLLLTGCGYVWRERFVPVTEDQRKKVAEQVERIMHQTPKVLAGHDQDWDDAIRMAHIAAEEELCPPTYWEWDCEIQTWTGRWRYPIQVQSGVEKPL